MNSRNTNTNALSLDDDNGIHAGMESVGVDADVEL
jgi:hypothetical protein